MLEAHLIQPARGQERPLRPDPGPLPGRLKSRVGPKWQHHGLRVGAATRGAPAEGAADAGGRAEGRLEEVDPLSQRSGGSESEPGEE